MSRRHARHDRPHPRLLGDAPQLGALDRPLRGPRLHASWRPRTPASRSRSRRSTRTRRRSRPDRPADHRPPRGGRRRARPAADPHRPLGRRRVHPAPARPRLRRRRRGDQLGADRGRQAWSRCRRSGRRSRCCKNPANRHRAVGFTPEQWHYAFTNTFSEEESLRALRALPHPRLRLDLLGQRARQHPPRQGRHLGRLRQRRPRAAAVHLGQRGPPHAAEDPAVERQALQVGHDHRGQGVRRAAPAARRAGLGGRSPTTPSTGPLRHATRRARGVRLTHIGGPTVLIEVGGLAPAHRPDVRPPGRRYRFGWGTASRKLAGPAIAAGDLGRDRRGAAHPRPPRRQPRPGRAGAAPVGRRGRHDRRRARGGSAANARGLAPWETTRLDGAGRRPRSRSRRRRAATARRFSRPIVGDVIGFALRWDGPGPRRRCGSPATRCCTTACARSPTGARSTRRAAAPRRRAVPGHRAACATR